MIRARQDQIAIELKSLRQILPEGPGVYLFKDRSQRIIYVGKAKNLKKRVISYLQPGSELSPKTALMINRAESLDYILTSTENEAFILESSLIKRYMPRYNVVLRDDKQYPCLRLNIKEPYPRLGIVRQMRKDGSVYFGPFSSSHSVRTTLKLIDKLFQLRKCKTLELPKRTRPCLNFQLGRCLGPCSNAVDIKSYNGIVHQVRLFLEGRNRELVARLKKDMNHCADKQNYEEAARIRDQIMAVEKTIERQDVVSPRMEDQDVIGIAQKDGLSRLVLLFIRKGYLIGRRDFHFRDTGSSVSEITESFIKQYYRKETFIPKNILISEQIEDLVPIMAWLSDMAGKRVSIVCPLKGEKRRIVRMAVSNAENLLEVQTGPSEEDLLALSRSTLRLNSIPRRMEGLDISNLQGEMAVGTVVSFVDGLPDKSGYRNYKIRGIEGIDDYGMMSELVRRRVSGGSLPDLFVVDGGKGHLSVIKGVLDDLSREEMPEVIALAKAEKGGADETTDKVYLVGRKNPLSLRPGHPVLMLLMRIRDEAHRRAVTYHRKLRSKNLKESVLDRIPGIGPQRKKLLLKHFGDVDALSLSSREDLILIPGISKSLAENILRFFQ
jgi:excinuclease ABC subunit C